MCSLSLTGSLWMGLIAPANGQVVPDDTLPQGTIATPEGTRFRIEGGTRAGSNLFHSFQEFSVPAGFEALFDNSLDVENIFSRVTGDGISAIDGTIGANGTANLFLINPNGIVFGTNARLNIGGSFLGTTADSVVFQDGSFFSATAPGSTPLLTVSVPVGVQFNRPSSPTTGEIRVEGSGNIQFVSSDGVATLGTGTVPSAGGEISLNATESPEDFEVNISGTLQGLSVNSGETLALVGRGITVSGGTLRTEGGNVALGSVFAGFVGLNFAESLPLSYGAIADFQDIRLEAAAAIDTSSQSTVSGSIQLQGRQVILGDGSIIFARLLGEEMLPSTGDIVVSVNASERVELSGISPFDDNLGDRQASVLIAGTTVPTDSQSINIVTGDLALLDGGVISSNTIGFGSGRAGSIFVTASGDCQMWLE
ncbi:MAG: filamentous hemagglutinin N-terminal domain-containing protein [Coleofasciculaceae cyanobacterium SM2_3_26]|nr:filamentous hemagglutinin N-terminal domain-containing protein [Coleofasciculaceae cyanobacterium SM2_3_26]